MAMRSWVAAVFPGKNIILDPQEPDVFFEFQWSKAVIVLHHLNPSLSFPIDEEPLNKSSAFEKEVLLFCKILISFEVAAYGLIAPALAALETLVTTEETLQSGLAVYVLQPLLAQIFAKSGHASHALDIAEFLLSKGANDAAMTLATAAPLQELGSKGVSPLLAQRYRRLLKEVLESEKLPQRKAVCHYNLANSLRFTGHHKESITQYILAARADEHYFSRSYWWAELAGCMYLTNRRRLALFYYQTARDMGEARLDVRVLIGDVLLHLGRFSESAAAFDEHTTIGRYLSAEFALKRWLARFFATKFGNTKRHVELALRTAKRAYSVPRPAQCSLLEEAIELDPLCEYAWFNYACWQSEIHPDDEHRYWLAAAILCPWDITAQLNGLAALQAKEDETSKILYGALLAEMYRRDPSTLESEFLKKALSDSNGNQQEARQRVGFMMKLAEQATNMFSAQSLVSPFAWRVL